MNLHQTKSLSHYKIAEEIPFTEEEIKDVTILFSGLTSIHETFLKGALENLGYQADYLPVPDNESLSYGKEYCNRGQCNPTYYIVGNLIKFLKKMRQDGVENIEKKYLCLTIGGCGPCRFGMYEAEFNKALTDAGFEGFRVVTISQGPDAGSSTEEEGLKRDRKFYTLLAKGIMVGDMISELKYKIKPYEVEVGSTDGAVAEAVNILYEAFKSGESLYKPLRKAKKILSKVEVDYSRVKPKVKIVGEFWAQTTEGDGNYNLPSWLEEEGCEVLVQPVSGWLDYVLWYEQRNVFERLITRKSFKEKRDLFAILMKVKLADYFFKFYFNYYRAALGFIVSPLTSQKKLARLSDKYYNSRISGGEGHLEVAKNLLSIKEKKAHLVISVKPFGCMPSTQSDGVQSKVMADFKDGLFIPIETSGDGEVNVKSRVQMKLYEARERAKEEFCQFLVKAGISEERKREIVSNPKIEDLSLIKLPTTETTTAGNYIRYLFKRG